MTSLVHQSSGGFPFEFNQRQMVRTCSLSQLYLEVGHLWTANGNPPNAHTQMHMYIHTHTSIYIYICMCIYIYTYIYIYISMYPRARYTFVGGCHPSLSSASKLGYPSFTRSGLGLRDDAIDVRQCLPGSHTGRQMREKRVGKNEQSNSHGTQKELPPQGVLLAI